jgi:hypothetical protein
VSGAGVRTIAIAAKGTGPAPSSSLLSGYATNAGESGEMVVVHR